MRSLSETPEQRFNRLYEQTSDDVLAYLARRSPSMDDAADALAETFTAAWKKLDSLPDGDRARLWLFGAAHIELRKASSRARSDDGLVAQLASELVAATGHQFSTYDRDESLWQAVAQLSPRDREILALTAWEGLAPREIGTVLGMSANAVRLRLTRARRTLRVRLNGEQCLPARPAPIVPHSGS